MRLEKENQWQLILNVNEGKCRDSRYLIFPHEKIQFSSPFCSLLNTKLCFCHSQWQHFLPNTACFSLFHLPSSSLTPPSAVFSSFRYIPYFRVILISVPNPMCMPPWRQNLRLKRYITHTDAFPWPLPNIAAVSWCAGCSPNYDTRDPVQAKKNPGSIPEFLQCPPNGQNTPCKLSTFISQRV